MRLIDLYKIVDEVYDNIKPFIGPLRSAVPVFNDLMLKLETGIAKGEEAADDVVDNADGKLAVIEGFSLAAGDAFTSLGGWIGLVRAEAAATDDTPDKITISEGHAIVTQGYGLYPKFKAAYDALADAEEAAKSLGLSDGEQA